MFREEFKVDIKQSKKNYVQNPTAPPYTPVPPFANIYLLKTLRLFMGAREDKYREKISGEVRKKLYDEQKDSMVANETQPTKDLVEIEIKTKHICDTAPALLQYYYIIFAKECYSKTLSHAGETLINEFVILEQKWALRGLDHTYLDLIKEMFIKIECFKLDVSLLDGNHRLC